MIGVVRPPYLGCPNAERVFCKGSYKGYLGYVGSIGFRDWGLRDEKNSKRV